MHGGLDRGMLGRLECCPPTCSWVTSRVELASLLFETCQLRKQSVLPVCNTGPSVVRLQHQQEPAQHTAVESGQAEAQHRRHTVLTCAMPLCPVPRRAVLCCAEMVTCVDVCGMNVMTASLDGSIALWDLRVSNEHNTITTIRAAGNESVRHTAVGEGGHPAAWLRCTVETGQ